jgi:hypothetical protein
VNNHDVVRVRRSDWMPAAALMCGVVQLVPPVGQGSVDIAQGWVDLVLAVVAIVLGHRVMRETKQKGGGRRWFARVALVLGYGSIAWKVLILCVAVVASGSHML